jgi:hypothetical protein
MRPIFLIAGRYIEDQIWVFGEVIGQLADEIELAARAKLAKRLARSDNAPFNIVMILAFDDSIEIAGPVLQHSQRLDTKGCLFLHTPIEARNEALGKPTKRPRYSFCLSLNIDCSLPLDRDSHPVLPANGPAAARFSLRVPPLKRRE